MFRSIDSLEQPVFRSIDVAESSSSSSSSFFSLLDGMGIHEQAPVSISSTSSSSTTKKLGPDSSSLSFPSWSITDSSLPSLDSLAPISMSSERLVTDDGDNGLAALMKTGTSTTSTTTSSLPPLQPEYIERWTSFITRDEAALSRIATALSLLAVDFTVDTSAFTIRGDMHEGSESCSFRVHLYRSTEVERKDELVVEVQRRSGDVLLFNRYYRSLVQHINHHNPELIVSAYAITTSTTPTPAITTDSEVQDCDDATLQSLITISSSPFVDVSREGSKALANVSSNPNNLPLLSYSIPLSRLIPLLLASTSVETARCAALLVEHMVTARSGASSSVVNAVNKSRKLLVEGWLVAMITLLSSSNTPTDTRRHLAASLVSCAATSSTSSSSSSTSSSIDIKKALSSLPTDTVKSFHSLLHAGSSDPTLAASLSVISSFFF